MRQYVILSEGSDKYCVQKCDRRYKSRSEALDHVRIIKEHGKNAYIKRVPEGLELDLIPHFTRHGIKYYPKPCISVESWNIFELWGFIYGMDFDEHFTGHEARNDLVSYIKDVIHNWES